MRRRKGEGKKKTKTKERGKKEKVGRKGGDRRIKSLSKSIPN